VTGSKWWLKFGSIKRLGVLNTLFRSRYNLKRRVASLPPISSEVFTEKVLQARAATTAEADRAGFHQVCDVCQKTYFSENSYRNHIGSQKHKVKALAMAHKAHGSVAGDDVSSVMSSTFSLGEPLPAVRDELDSDAEDEFSEVVEGLKKAKLNERPSPVRRPSNPHPSAEGNHKREHVVSEDSSETGDGTATPVPTLTLRSCLSDSLGRSLGPEFSASCWLIDVRFVLGILVV
jgi:pre-60S factor REI1